VFDGSGMIRNSNSDRFSPRGRKQTNTVKERKEKKEEWNFLSFSYNSIPFK
jgi:hypothetical protein